MTDSIGIDELVIVAAVSQTASNYIDDLVGKSGLDRRRSASHETIDLYWDVEDMSIMHDIVRFFRLTPIVSNSGGKMPRK